MPNDEISWEAVASRVPQRTAHHLSDLLQAELIPARLVSATLTPGGDWNVQVPADRLAAAQRLMQNAQVTDAELRLLAVIKDSPEG